MATTATAHKARSAPTAAGARGHPHSAELVQTPAAPKRSKAAAQEARSGPRSPSRVPHHAAARPRLRVDEGTRKSTPPPPLLEEAALVGAAGDAFVPAGPSEALTGEPGARAAAPAAPAEDARLTSDGVAVILKAVFKGIALLTRDDYYAIEDMEIEEITAPIARQVVRIPVVASVLTDNVSDLIAIGAGAAALVGDRLAHFAEVRRAKEAARLEPLRSPTAAAAPSAASAPAASTERAAEPATRTITLGDGKFQELRESRGAARFAHLAVREA